MSVYHLLSTNFRTWPFIKARTLLNRAKVDKGNGSQLGRQKKSLFFSAVTLSVYCLPSIITKRKRGGIKSTGRKVQTVGRRWSEAETLAHAIHLAGKQTRETLLAEFTSYVSQHFDEQEFARSFATVHKVFHDWMDQ